MNATNERTQPIDQLFSESERFLVMAQIAIQQGRLEDAQGYSEAAQKAREREMSHRGEQDPALQLPDNHHRP